MTSDLATRGLVMLGSCLTREQIDDIRRHLGSGPLHDPYGYSRGTFTTETVPPASRLGYYKRSDVVRAPHVLALANREDVLARAAAVLGCRPAITDLNLWWSFPTDEPAKDSQLWHRDCDDWTMVKLFVYLTDVDDTNGPHVYAYDTAGDDRLTAITRYSDDEILPLYPDIATVTGPAGAGMMSNPRGMHRATVPKSARRLMFEATYSVMALPARHYGSEFRKLQIPASEAGGIDPWVSRFFVDVV